jgi:hypothetical protein
MSRTKEHQATVKREEAVCAVFESSGLLLEQERMGGGATDEEEEEGESDAAEHPKKKARRGSGSSSAGGAAERSMSQFAEVMSKFYTPPPPPAAAAAAASAYTAEQWLADCMVSDEQRKSLADLLPDATKPFTPLILSSFDAATLTACGLKPFQLTAWEKLAAKHA